MVNDFILENYEHKISCHAQIGGIESCMITRGPDSGIDISVINTGGGLRFRVISGNGLDIADAFYNQFCLSSMNPMGTLLPADGNAGEWLRSSGFMRSRFLGSSPIKGHIPTSVESVHQPDPKRGKPHRKRNILHIPVPAAHCTGKRNPFPGARGGEVVQHGNRSVATLPALKPQCIYEKNTDHRIRSHADCGRLFRSQGDNS